MKGGRLHHDATPVELAVLSAIHFTAKTLRLISLLLPTVLRSVVDNDGSNGHNPLKFNKDK